MWWPLSRQRQTALPSPLQNFFATQNTMQLAWDEQRRLNSTSAQNIVKFESNIDYFTLNLDKTCFLASDGIVRVIGSINKKKHEKNIGDCRDSITVVRVGSAAGIDGPRIYLAKGKTLEYNQFKDFCRCNDAPPGSMVSMTPNAYMTDETWRDIVDLLCQGI